MLPREEDTGWGFVGHQAATAMQRLAGRLDGLSRKGRGYDACSFHNDMWKGGEALRASGRLQEVKLYWMRWWDEYKAANDPPR